MRLSKWMISSKGKISRTDSLAVNREARIILLDDHRIFRTGIINFCIRPFFKNIEVLPFRNGDYALEYLKKQVKDNCFVNLFITDINHPGIRGNELVKQIRDYEREFGCIRPMPILIISMVDETTYPELIGEKLVNAYLTKASDPDVIIDYIEQLLYIEQNQKDL